MEKITKKLLSAAPIGDGVTDDAEAISNLLFGAKQDRKQKQRFKYTPITHKEAWDNLDAYSLATEKGGDAVVIKHDAVGNRAARQIIDADQWYKMEPCRIVDIAEAYRVLARGGKVLHLSSNIEAEINDIGQLYWAVGSEYKHNPVVVTEKSLSDWIVLDEGTKGE